MELVVFKESLAASQPPNGLSEVLIALWYDANGNWDKAHDYAQDVYNADGSWVHAYLHRKEGDLGNASYWYSKAGKKMPQYSLDEEWEVMAADLLKRG
ncbi:MAG: hypothetical protein KTR26_05255 [Flammeovirgaceae bacterium]|nr:hypothetical protein [Flammeovirgaceae bacterium]